MIRQAKEFVWKGLEHIGKVLEIFQYFQNLTSEVYSECLLTSQISIHVVKISIHKIDIKVPRLTASVHRSQNKH